MNPKPSDPVVEEIREIRRRISERFGHDPERLVAYYIKIQEQHRDRLLEPAEKSERTDESAA